MYRGEGGRWRSWIRDVQSHNFFTGIFKYFTNFDEHLFSDEGYFQWQVYAYKQKYQRTVLRVVSHFCPLSFKQVDGFNSKPYFWPWQFCQLKQQINYFKKRQRNGQPQNPHRSLSGLFCIKIPQRDCLRE